MYLQAQRIESYRNRSGELPPGMGDAGSAVPHIHYVKVGVNAFQLVGTVRDTAIVYNSTESATEFVGDAVQKLLGGV